MELERKPLQCQSGSQRAVTIDVSGSSDEIKTT